jgi:hypothetical protein
LDCEEIIFKQTEEEKKNLEKGESLEEKLKENRIYKRALATKAVLNEEKNDENTDKNDENTDKNE